MELQGKEVVNESPRPHEQRHRLRRGLVMVVCALALMAVGALGGILASRYLDLGGARPAPVATALTAPLAMPPGSEPPAASTPEAVAAGGMSPEAVSRAGIKTAPAEVVASQAVIQLPGTVLADAYREVKVVPIVGGIVTKVHVELGTMVKRRAPLATLFSTELAEAQTKYLSMQAMLSADQQKV